MVIPEQRTVEAVQDIEGLPVPVSGYRTDMEPNRRPQGIGCSMCKGTENVLHRIGFGKLREAFARKNIGPEPQLDRPHPLLGRWYSGIVGKVNEGTAGIGGGQFAKQRRSQLRRIRAVQSRNVGMARVLEREGKPLRITLVEVGKRNVHAFGFSVICRYGTHSKEHTKSLRTLHNMSPAPLRV